MTHALAQALPQPHASRTRPDPARIFTLSGTFALNLLVFGLLMVPIAMPPPTAQAPAKPEMTIRSIVRPPEPVIVDIVPIRPPRPTTPIATRERPAIAPPIRDTSAPVVTSNTGSEPVVDTGHADDATPPGPDIGPASGPAPMQLAYRIAPAPVYPRAAMQRQLTGIVLLRVLVDIDGRPLDVSIARSSGHRELDEAARAQVLKRWSFQPATRDGAPVQAIGLVPVEFSLRR